MKAWHFVNGKLLDGRRVPHDLVEARWDGPIPARELDRLRYPTRDNQIARAKARIAGAKRNIAERKAQWRMQHAYAQWLGLADIDELWRIAGIHIPHLRGCRRELLAWKAHLTELEN